jgi:hypothetical protein
LIIFEEKSSEIGLRKTALSAKAAFFQNGFFFLWLKDQAKVLKIYHFELPCFVGKIM